MIYDTIILGGGIVGASAAYALARQKHDVLLIDRYAPGHKYGSSHGDGRIVRFNYTESIYIRMAQHAFSAWEQLSTAAGEPLLQQTGLLEYGPPDCEAIRVSEQLLAESDIPYETFTPSAANEQFPQFHFADDTRILFQESGAVAFASPAVKALWRLTREAGSTTRTDTRITHIDANDQQVTLRDDQGQTFTGRSLVLAGGSWMGALCKQLDVHLPLTVTQEVLCYFPPSSETSVNHRVGTMPAMVDYHNQEKPFYCLPQVDIPGVKAGWHHSGTEINPDDPRPAAPPHIIDHLTGWVVDVFPHLVSVPMETLTCLYTNTPDYHFIIDKHPTLSNIAIAAGFSGHGFKFGPTIGELLSALIRDEAPALPLTEFRLARFNDDSRLQKRIGA